VPGKKIIWDKDIIIFGITVFVAGWLAKRCISYCSLCYVYYISRTWYLRSWINATSLTICQPIPLAMHGFTTAEFMCYLGNTVTEECSFK